MDRAEIETRVKKVLAEQLAVDEQQVVPDARFAEDLNADSLDLVEAVLALEEEWSIEIPEDEMESVKTVGQAVDLVATQARGCRRPSWPRVTQTERPGPRPGRRKVVITGIGPVTPVGTGVDEFWAGLIDRAQRRPRDRPVPHRRPAREGRRRRARLRARRAGSTRRRSAAPTASRTTRSRPASSPGRTPATRRCRPSEAASSSGPASAGSRRSSCSTACCSRRARAACRRSWCRR